MDPFKGNGLGVYHNEVIARLTMEFSIISQYILLLDPIFKGAIAEIDALISRHLHELSDDIDTEPVATHLDRL